MPPGPATLCAMNSFRQPIRLILADDHTLVRAGLSALVQTLPDVVVVAEAGDGRELLELVQKENPDVVVTDISMPGLNGLEAAERLAREFPRVRVIILSMHPNEEYVFRALKAGVLGYLLKKSAVEELGIALQSVLRSEVYISREISEHWSKPFLWDNRGQWKSPLEHLSSRQREILQLIAEGRNTKEIAERLGISPKTVEYHRLRMMTILNVRDIPGLVRFALRVGVIPAES